MRKFILSTASLLLCFSLLAQTPMNKLVAKKASASVTYATWNPSDNGGVTLSNGNLTAARNASTAAVRATIGISSGKWTWEIVPDVVGNQGSCIATSAFVLTADIGGEATCWTYYHDDGSWYNNGYVGGPTSASANTDVFTFALDMDAGTLIVYRNGTAVNGGTPLFTGLTGTIYPMLGVQNLAATGTANFGPTLVHPVGGYNEGVYN